MGCRGIYFAITDEQRSKLLSLTSDEERLDYYKEAIEYLSEASDLPDKQMSFFPVDFTVLRYGRLALQAKAKLEIGDYETAERLIKEAIDRMPDKPEAYKFYAELYKKLGNYRGAISQYELASQKDPGNFYHDFQIGEIHFSLGWLIKAKLHFKKALQKSPDHPAILLKLAIIERGCGRYDRAITYFENLMDNGHNDIHVNTEYAFCILDQGEYEILAKKLSSISENEFMSWMNYLLNLYFDKKERFENDLSLNYPNIAGKTNRDIASYLEELAVRSRSEGNLHLADLILRARLFYAEEGIVESLKELAAVQIENNRHFQAIATLEQSLQPSRRWKWLQKKVREQLLRPLF